MIVFKITYDTSVVADFAPTFNNGWGYDYTTKTSTSGTLKTVTYESDTAFTSISIPDSNRSCVKSIYIDASGITGFWNTFASCQAMTDFTMVNASNKLTQLYQATYDCTILTNITYENCDLSSVTNIQNVFNGGPKDAVTKATFKNVKFNNTTKSMISLLCKATTMVVEDCDFSSVTSFYTLFAGCIGLKGTLDFSMHDFTNVYETNSMFKGCTNLTKIIMPKGAFDKLTNCGGMFQDCTSLVEVDLSGFHIPNAQNISYMFGGCVLIEEIDLSALGVLNPTNINQMFVSCQKLKRVNLSGVKVPKATSFSHMFYDSTVVEWIDISNVLAQASDVTNFWKSGAVVNDIGMLYCPANVINSFAKNMVNSGRTCNIYYHDAKLEDLTVDSRFNYIYCEEYHGDVVSTPDDLELYCNYYYDRNTKKSSPCYQDTLDLTTGTITRKNIKARLNDCIAKYGMVEGSLVTVNGGDMVRVKYNHMNTSTGTFPVQVDGEVTGLSVTGIALNTSQGGYDGAWYPTSDIEHAYTNPNTIFMFFNPSRFDGIDYTDLTTIKNWLIEQDFTLIVKIQNASVYTEQLPTSLNPLKSYYNGSIQTSSQQLTPTLKTTLPVSNKFTTTNLTSSSTYNVYFDGTATKLDAGGTIITNPVSPCEVECGGTTLTIEGTDIQNVRVLETTNKNEVGSVNETIDVELNAFKTRKYENLVDKKWVVTGSSWTLDEKTNTLFTNNAGRWSGIEVTTGGKYPKGTSLVHVEFDVDTQDNRCAWISFGNSVGISNVNFRDLKLSNDTARICQGSTSGIGQIFASYISKGHFSNLLYVTPTTDGKQRDIKFTIYTDSTPISSLVCTATNCVEGSIDGYTACADTGVTISNMRIRVVENYPDDTSFSQHASLIRQGTGQVIWQDMDMTMPYTNTYLARPIKLRSLGTTYDSYNPVTEELTKRISVSETDGSYSVLSSPIVTKVTDSKLCRNIFNVNGEVKNWSSTPTINGNEMTFKGTYFTAVRVPKLITGKTYTLFYECVTGGRIHVLSDYTNQNSGFVDTGATWLPAGSKGVKTFIHSGASNGAVMFFANSSGTTYKNIMIVEGKFDNYEALPYFENEFILTYDNMKDGIPQLYANGQVKVYSDSDVYPTTILNGQSTNNYEVNELNKSNNYTIRYDGTCESINLANKSNEQGTNRIVKSGTDGRGNLTFVNNSEDIDNVLLVQNDVREQEINHFNGLQTVEISGMIVQSPISKHLFYNHGLNDFVPSVNTNYSFDENNNLILSNGYGNNVDTMLQTVDKYTLEKGDSVIFRVVGVENFAADHRLFVKLATQNFAFGGYYPDSYVNFKAPKVQEIINEQGYCDVVYTYNSETTTDNIQISNYFGKWIISSVVLCKQSQEIITPTIIDLPQPVQLNSLPDGTCDTYNPITGEYVQRVNGKPYTGEENWIRGYYQFNCMSYSLELDNNNPKFSTSNYCTDLKQFDNSSIDDEGYFLLMGANYSPILTIRLKRETLSGISFEEWLVQSGIVIFHAIKPITTQLTPIEIPTFEGGIIQLITTDGKVFPMIEYSMPTTNRYSTAMWNVGSPITHRNATEIYINGSTTPTTPTETMTFTKEQLSSGSIVINDNGDGLMVLNGDYTGRDIPYFTGMRSVESIEIETSGNSDQPLFGKGGRR